MKEYPEQVLKISLAYKRVVGLTILASVAVIRSFVWYKYAPGVIDTWHWLLTALILLPVEGVISEFYGFWRGERLLAFLVGFLPSSVALIVPIMRLGCIRALASLCSSPWAWGSWASGEPSTGWTRNGNGLLSASSHGSSFYV